jgi:hypothetical protein
VKRLSAMFFSVILVLLSLDSVFALPYYYSMAGSGIEEDNTSIGITGQMIIDNLSIIYIGSAGAAFFYNIPYFYINIGGLTFSGAGRIRSEHYADGADVGFTATFDTFDLLSSDQKLYWSMLSYGATFYYENGTPYDKGPDPKDYYNIPYLIEFSQEPIWLDGWGNQPVNIDHMFISRISAPIPEPSTMILLGTGLAALVGFRRKFRH